MTLPRGAIDNAEEFENLMRRAKTEKVTIYAVWCHYNTLRFDRISFNSKTRYSGDFLAPMTVTRDQGVKTTSEIYHAKLALSENEFNYHLFKNYFWAWAYYLRLKGESK